MNDVLAVLILALIQVESGGDPKLIGDNGEAVGVLQIHIEVVQDVNRVYKTKYKANDRYDVEKSKEICRLYLTYYATEKRLGHKPTQEDMARIWNSGPKGFTKSVSDVYWIKVKKALETIEHDQKKIQNNRRVD